MREHALPQDVVGYRFHIIGNMTLKQFGEVAGGCVIGFLFYSSNLPDFVKWPLIVISAGAGAMAAFVPFEERPLDHWVVAFFKALYRPTQFYWTKVAKIPDAFLFQPQAQQNSLTQEVDLSPARRQRVKEYLRSVNKDDRDEYEKANAEKVEEILDSFETPITQKAFAYATDVVQPLTQAYQSYDQPMIEEMPMVQTLPPSPQPEPTLQVEMPTITQPPTTSMNPVAVPIVENISITPSVSENQVNENTDVVPTETGTFIDQAVFSGTGFQAPTQAVVQNRALPFPNPPTEPNKIVGMVIDAQNNPISNAIVEVITSEGLSARAVKTNAFGQFFITTPLNNGVYSVVAEKEGLQFSPKQLQVAGQIIDPIEVRSL